MGSRARVVRVTRRVPAVFDNFNYFLKKMFEKMTNISAKSRYKSYNSL